MTEGTEQTAGHATLADRDPRVTFSFEGQAISAPPGHSIAAALYAAGVRIFSRSFKYHRPRGLFCGTGDCPNCLMRVDGRPNVRTCIEPVREGQEVSRQNAWPSADFDLMSLFDRLDRFLPVGFYYKSFHKPRWVWPIFEHAVRHIAGLGHIDTGSCPEHHSVVEHFHTEICVIGGGPSGIAAAESAAATGARVMLLERQATLGGHLLDKSCADTAHHGPNAANEQPAHDSLAALCDIIATSGAQSLPQRLEQIPTLQVHCDTTVFGIYEGNLVGAVQPDRLIKIRAQQIIVCTGGRERPFLFQNNDLPGIMLGRAALTLARRYGILAGQRAVVLTDSDRGHELANQLAICGVNVVTVVDQRPDWRAAQAATGVNDTRRSSIPVLFASTVITARGRNRLKAIDVASMDRSAAGNASAAQTIKCDLLCMVSQLYPANELLLQAGMRFQRQGASWLPAGDLSAVRAAGAAAGTVRLVDRWIEGRQQGIEAARTLIPAPPQLPDDLGSSEINESSNVSMAPPGVSRDDRGSRQTDEVNQVADQASSFDVSAVENRKSFVCFCEDVTVKDIGQAIAEGFDEIETLKRYSTVNMGPCQGKMCSLLATELCAGATGRDVNMIGLTTSRPPAVPIALRVLAANRRHPIRRTPLHHWHEAAGARWMDAGQWKRPESYGEPAVEVIAVRHGVGLIDVSTLGKIEVAGRDAVTLLERIYLNKWSDLKVGRSRYGVMCNEDGIVFDDGVCARIGRDQFYLTATTGNADGVFQWLEMWRDTWGLDVSIVNHTSAMAAMNLAGPHSREVLARLTALDVSKNGFPYMAMRDAEVAGVPCRLLRIGFVGELGFEIHCASALAWHLWEALYECGRAFRLQPFGVEAQRILRLEKGHLIIGADTDALSNPLEAGLEGLVRFEKPEFVGRTPLIRMKQRGPRSRLVGFTVPHRLQAVPEGSQIVAGGYPVGRVTSSRVSPTTGGSIGLAWVPTNGATPGSRFYIRWNSTDVEAVVRELPFYDARGDRLKS